ncbi:hypothetical protein [Synechococcus sp. M16CYN]|uniref:hypothetical protein n=1 Tax=Synechococcus sp. M16CYN TaxID=3103139 RepID=UPI00325591F5
MAKQIYFFKKFFNSLESMNQFNWKELKEAVRFFNCIKYRLKTILETFNMLLKSGYYSNLLLINKVHVLKILDYKNKIQKILQRLIRVNSNITKRVSNQKLSNIVAQKQTYMHKFNCLKQQGKNREAQNLLVRLIIEDPLQEELFNLLNKDLQRRFMNRFHGRLNSIEYELILNQRMNQLCLKELKLQYLLSEIYNKDLAG